MPHQQIERHLFKCCTCHTPKTCFHPWHGQYRHVRISLSRWAKKRPRTITEARAALGALKQAIDTGTYSKYGEGISVTATTPLRDVVARHLEWVRARKLRSHFRVYADFFIAQWGDEPLLRLARQPHEIEERLQRIADERNWAGATYNRYRGYGWGLFSRAKKWGYIDQNPFENVAKRRESGYRRRRISPEQEAALIAACDLLDQQDMRYPKKLSQAQADDMRRLHAAGSSRIQLATQFEVARSTVSEVLTGDTWHPHRRATQKVGRMMRGRLFAALDLGLRRGEMLAVQLRDIDFEHWRINLPASKTKTNVDQVVYVMTQRLRDFLIIRRAEIDADSYVFGTERGYHLATFKSWKRLFRLAGLPVGRRGYVWHDLRHEFASWLLDMGASIHEAQELLRHSDIGATARYLATSEGRLRALASTFSHRVSRTVTSQVAEDTGRDQCADQARRTS